MLNLGTHPRKSRRASDIPADLATYTALATNATPRLSLSPGPRCMNISLESIPLSSFLSLLFFFHFSEGVPPLYLGKPTLAKRSPSAPVDEVRTRNSCRFFSSATGGAACLLLNRLLFNKTAMPQTLLAVGILQRAFCFKR